LRSPELQRLVRVNWEEQRRFPLKVATTLSQQFAGHGLQFFKVNRTVTHVAVARPHFLDLEATPVSEGVKRIVDFINKNPKCTRLKLVQALAPTPAAAPSVPAVPAVPADAAAAAPAPAPAPVPVPVPVPVPEASPEQTAVASDLHWLIHEGHVIEFATNGFLETAKKPLPRPPKPEKTPRVPAPAGEAPVPPAAAVPAPDVPPSLPVLEDEEEPATSSSGPATPATVPEGDS
jgi:hypothetical protein